MSISCQQPHLLCSAHRHCSLLTGSATIKMTRGCSSVVEFLPSTSLWVHHSTEGVRGRLWEEGWVLDGLTVNAGEPSHWKCRAGTQRSVHTDRHSAGWMPAGPLEHRFWAEGAAGVQEETQQWLTEALAVGIEHLAPELGFPLQLSVEWIRESMVSFKREREGGKAKRTVGHPPTGR